VHHRLQQLCHTPSVLVAPQAGLVPVEPREQAANTLGARIDRGNKAPAGPLHDLALGAQAVPEGQRVGRGEHFGHRRSGPRRVGRREVGELEGLASRAEARAQAGAGHVDEERVRLGRQPRQRAAFQALSQQPLERSGDLPLGRSLGHQVRARRRRTGDDEQS
jgi:hypothetical protein